VDPRSLPLGQRIALLVKALDGAEKTNKALATCADGDAMVDILLGASAKLGLGLTRRDLMQTPPIRDWIWFKNNDPLLTVGDAKPRYQREKGASDAPDPSVPRKRFLGLF
jgi:hypothetical protein